MEKGCRVPLQLLGRFGTVMSWCHLTVNASDVAKNKLITLDNKTGKQLDFGIICYRKGKYLIAGFVAFCLKPDTNFQLLCGSRHLPGVQP